MKSGGTLVRVGGKDSSEQSRRFARVKPSGRISTTAGIITDAKSPVINCRLIDYSAGGACVELASSDVALPSRFELIYGGTKKRCSLRWKKGRRIGVSF